MGDAGRGQRGRERTPEAVGIGGRLIDGPHRVQRLMRALARGEHAPAQRRRQWRDAAVTATAAATAAASASASAAATAAAASAASAAAATAPGSAAPGSASSNTSSSSGPERVRQRAAQTVAVQLELAQASQAAELRREGSGEAGADEPKRTELCETAKLGGERARDPRSRQGSSQQLAAEPAELGRQRAREARLVDVEHAE